MATKRRRGASKPRKMTESRLVAVIESRETTSDDIRVE